MLDIMYEIYEELSENCSDTAGDDIEDIGTTINTFGVFNQVNEIEEKRLKIKDKIKTSASTDMRD